MSDKYPMRMVHPQERRTVINKMDTETGPIAGLPVGGTRGTPEWFMPVMVNNQTQEEAHRAMGYLAFGETPPMTTLKEYPLMLQHPDFKEAVPEQTIATVDEHGNLHHSIIKAVPGQFPPWQVNTPEEEAAWSEKGYRRPGKYDPTAIKDAIASPHVPGRVAEEWPKMVDGKVVDPRPKEVSTNYPKWIADGGMDKDGNPTGKVVHSQEQELELTGKALATPEPPKPVVDPRDAEIAELRARIEAMTAPKPPEPPQQEPETIGRPSRRRSA